MLPLQAGKIVEGVIETIAFGGEGILRHRGLVIFIPFTATGDVIRCRIIEIKKSFAKGEIVEILEPSPHRTTPPCPYFGTCGGCQIQHLNEEAQLKYKLDAVKDSLKRIGHLEVESLSIVPATLKWAYRRHVSLHLRPHQGAFQAGYIAIDNRSLVVVNTCPIFNTAEDPIMRCVQELVQTLPNPQHEEGRVTVLKNQHGRYILAFHFAKSFKTDPNHFKKALERYPLIIGILLNRGKQELVWGDPYALIELEGLFFRFTPQSFIQNHPEQSANIYRHIRNLTHSVIKKTILDLYCGFGMTSLLLAKQGHTVIGVECNAEAIQFANENAQLNGLSVRFIEGDVEKVLPSLSSPSPDVIIVNPPRTGLSKNVLQQLLEARPQELIYVSCMPATLARDLALLCQKDYKIQNCTAYDMFPQTAHVETLVYLKKV